MEENVMQEQEFEAALDADWDEVPADQPENAPETPENGGDETKPQQDQPESEGPQEAPKQAEEQADQPETFTLKNRDETRQVDRDELIAMAQKGWDYDTVRSERDQLRQYRDEADPAISLVKAFAEKSGMTVVEYIDYCRKQEIMQSGVNEATAQAQLEVEKQQAAVAAQQARQQEEAQARQKAEAEQARQAAARKAEMTAFLTAYPDVQPGDIPKEVWAQVTSGMPLVTAYTMHLNQVLAADLAAERKNRENQAQTTGSMSSAGESAKDNLFDGWDED